MAVFNWPATDRSFHPASFTWGLRDNSRVFVSEMSGAMQSMSLPGARWAVMLEINNQAPEERARVEGFLSRIRQEHRIRMHRLDRPRPIGTVALTGVTLTTAAAQFASTISLSGCGASATMRAGSMLGLGGQLLMVAADATASGAGQMIVHLTHHVRAAHGPGAAVTLDRPTALWALRNRDLDFPRQRTIATPLVVELVEAFT